MVHSFTSTSSPSLMLGMSTGSSMRWVLYTNISE